jgi:hypothetical protein
MPTYVYTMTKPPNAIPITTQMVKLITTVYDKITADHSGHAA